MLVGFLSYMGVAFIRHSVMIVRSLALLLRHCGAVFGPWWGFRSLSLRLTYRISSRPVVLFA